VEFSAECLISIGAGLVAGSIALIGFGFDSAIEVASSLAALWRLARDEDEAARERAERRALRVIGACFMALAIYIAVDAIKALIDREAPAASVVGIVIAALSLVVMPVWSISSEGLPRSSTAERSRLRHVRPRSARFYRRSCSPGSDSMHGSAGGGLIRSPALPWFR
jgi:predicted Co/Zn/Cd cation transporter (cation efflux family)